LDAAHQFMKTSLIALAALPLLASACATSDKPTDELAGETEADAALDGKADGGAPDGVYTYFEVWSLSWGGFGVHRLNRSTTDCADGSDAWGCWAPELDFSESGLPDALQATLLDAADRDAYSYGAIALVRGRMASDRFIVTEGWVAEGDGISEGVFVKAKDSGVRCITTPCPSVLEKALNTSRSVNIAALDWSAGGFDDEQIGAFANDMLEPSGVILAGERYTFEEHDSDGKGRTATAVYRRLVEPECHVGGCAGQVCSDQEGVLTTCEWKDEYACYQGATCERQTDGTCGWTDTPELDACLGQN
jgi:hypothetical protein